MFSVFLGVILNISNIQVDAEIADTPALHAKGLMHRESLSGNHGMLFIYKEPRILSFWMKNTKVPLSIGFFDSEKKLLQVEEMNPPEKGATTLPLYKSKTSSQYALEMPLGWFKKNKISVGDKFTLQDFDE